jgi:hypothetical protein
MLTRIEPLRLFTVVASLCLFLPVHGEAQQDVIDAIRQAALDLQPERLGASYAAMINFAVNPDISTATFYIEADDVDNPTLSVYRLPLRYVFKSANHAWRPFVQANFDYQTIDTHFDDMPVQGESIDLTYRTYGGSLTLGAEIPLGKHLVLLPAIDVGIVRLESEADYHGVIGNTFVKPALDGLLFNWDADAWLLGASIGLDYHRAIYGIDFNVHGSLTYNYIETFDSSSDFIKFDSQVTTLVVNAETVLPTRMSIATYPLAVVVNAGYTTFLGSDGDEIGFGYFFESGLALEADLSRKQWVLKKLRLGAKAIYGEDVTGWSIIFGYRF